MPFWHRLVIAAAVLLAVMLVARLVDWWLSRKTVAPEIETRYRVLRRAVTAVIIAVGLFSALLVIPQVRAIAGGAARVHRRPRRDHRPRLAADSRQLHRGNPDRDDTACSDRRPRQLRGRARHRRGDRSHLHVHPHHRPSPPGRPEQQARLRPDRQRLHPQQRDVRRGARPRAACRRPRRRRSTHCGRTWPKSATRASTSARSTGLRPSRCARPPPTSSRQSDSSTTSGCAPTGASGHSASGRELQAQDQAEAATETQAAPSPRPRGRHPARRARGHGGRAAPSTSARAATWAPCGRCARPTTRSSTARTAA